MFNFQYSKIYQQEFEQFADVLLKLPMVFVTSKTYLGNSLVDESKCNRPREPKQIKLTKVNGNKN